MSGNRFDFLEFEDEEKAKLRKADAEADLGPDIAGMRQLRELDADGLPLAQVKIDDDPRGYRSFFEQAEVNEPFVPAISRRATEQNQVAFRAVEVFGKRGIRAGEFNFPTGIAIDRNGILYIADSYNHRIQRVTPDGGVAIIGGRGAARGQFLSPQSVATDPKNAFYVVEQGNHRVQKFTANGVLELVFGQQGHQQGELYGPTGIVVAADTGDILVADTGNCRIQRFNRYGQYVAAIYGGGSNGPLSSPQSLAIDSSDNIYVADTLAHRILHYDPAGRYMGQFGRHSETVNFSGTMSERFFEPRGCALDPAGILYVADMGNRSSEANAPPGRLHAIQLQSGNTEIIVEKLGRGLKHLARPSGLAVSPPLESSDDGRADLYVADTMNHRILRFAWN